MDAPSTPFHQWLPLVFMLPYLFASLLKSSFLSFQVAFFSCFLYVQREEDKWGLL
jgi:hypothetical protein